MREATITGELALEERITTPEQVADTAEEAALPPYLESLLAHVRLLIGVPFDYLSPDARLLPDESIRFFYLDRSWTDRLVDGVLAVGKAGTREQAHHQGQDAGIRAKLDQVERFVRPRQRRLGTAETTADEGEPAPADVVTGFVLRSALVSGWPHMEVRAFKRELPERVTAAAASADELKTLRLERLSPSVMLGLFEGIPQLVWFEEPHHGVQMGVRQREDGTFFVFARNEEGESGVVEPEEFEVHVRASNERVISVQELAQAISASAAEPSDVSPHLAVQLLQPPWRQRFQGGLPDPAERARGFAPTLEIAGSTVRLTTTVMRRLVREER